MRFKHNPERINILSSGGGTQSNAMIVLISQGKLPKPDLIILSDTEREMSEVFSYQRDHIAPLCEQMGVEYLIVPKSLYTKHDIEDARGKTVLPPFFTEWNGRTNKGECNKQPGFCSDKWKGEVVRRVCNERFPKSQFDMWLGMTTDELRRVKVTVGKWQKRYPLIEMRLSRSDAISIVENAGLPTPPRSACWMCPNRHNTEWQHMKEHCPRDFQKAIEFEKELQKEHPHLWLHKSGVPISDVVFSDGQMDIFSNFCDSGMCFT
ncbi:hypothetical protein [Vibrio scophthalmi]|uniref:Phosphoadenosine phosphosulphate reductase domain-containing protein n=1 Tax=Vibrio scophthalmi TaxID=45658 RepID=A0A1E3WKQ3_9VIBR|nr:hypothetical protein [Vibrio scophthalmi]ODS10356.1 hypothetical protein VSF3289_00611 [Vibrio scophthalmi]